MQTRHADMVFFARFKSTMSAELHILLNYLEDLVKDEVKSGDIGDASDPNIFRGVPESQLIQKIREVVRKIDTRNLRVNEKVKRSADLFNLSREFPSGLPKAEFRKRADKIRKAVFRYLREFKDPGLAVDEANSIQTELPFLLFDPSLGVMLKPGTKIQYTVADLVNFLGQFRPKGQVVQHDLGGKNPWYVKLQTPIIDFSFDTIINAAKNALSYEKDLDRIDSVISVLESMPLHGGELSADHTIFIKRMNYKQVIRKLIEIMEKLTDPSYLSTLVQDVTGRSQKRPMQTYEEENFDQIVASFFQKYPIALGTNPRIDRKRRKKIPLKMSLAKPKKKHHSKAMDKDIPELVSVPFKFAESRLEDM